MATGSGIDNQVELPVHDTVNNVRATLTDFIHHPRFQASRLNGLGSALGRYQRESVFT